MEDLCEETPKAMPNLIRGTAYTSERIPCPEPGSGLGVHHAIGPLWNWVPKHHPYHGLGDLIP